MFTRNAQQEIEQVEGKMAMLQALVDGISARGGIEKFFEALDALLAQSEAQTVSNLLAENERLMTTTIVPLEKPDIFGGGE